MFKKFYWEDTKNSKSFTFVMICIIQLVFENYSCDEGLNFEKNLPLNDSTKKVDEQINQQNNQYDKSIYEKLEEHLEFHVDTSYLKKLKITIKELLNVYKKHSVLAENRANELTRIHNRYGQSEILKGKNFTLQDLTDSLIEIYKKNA